MLPLLGMMGGGGGSFEGSSSATATAGNVHVGGLVFSPKARQDSIVTAGVVVLAVLAAVFLFRKG